MSELWGIAAILAGLGGLMLGVRLGQETDRISPEVARKIVHAGMGIISFSLPWVFPSPPPVWIAAILVVALFAAIRLVPAMARRIGSVLGGVDRVSLGEIYYPVGAALAFTLAHRAPFVFCGAMGTLAFGDTAGALVGSRWGRRRYAMPGGTKSVEGSVAVLIVSAGCAGFSLVAADHETWRAALRGAVFVGTNAAVVEAVCCKGLDNLLLPIAAIGLIELWISRSAHPGGLVLCTAASVALFSGLALAANRGIWSRGRKKTRDSAAS